MHVKAVLVDQRVAMIGSVNLNRRSVEKDEEVAVLVLDGSTVEQLEQHFDDDVTRAEPAAGPETEPSPGHRLLAKALHPIRREL